MFDRRTSKSHFIAQVYRREVISDEKSLLSFAAEQADHISMRKTWMAGHHCSTS